jgi:isopenicillin N synthase-like dioxygenase
MSTTDQATRLDVPIVDIAPFLAGTPAGKRAAAAAVGRACEDIGFLTIVGHGVPQELIERQYRLARAFFDLPVEEKLQAVLDLRGRGGYSPFQNISLARGHGRHAPADLRESLTYDGDADGHPWPERPAGLRDTWCAYYRAMDRLSLDLLHMFALALDLPETFFDDKVGRGPSSVTTINYPDQPTEPVPGQLRSGEHTDWGPLTILRSEDAPGGLQVANRRGEWVDVQTVPGAFVVNIGDMMMRWTNDRWASTLHRVANPPRDRALGSRRQSIVFFLNANSDAVITCIESCCTPERPAQYPPITAGDYLALKMQQTRGLAKEQAPGAASSTPAR